LSIPPRRGKALVVLAWAGFTVLAWAGLAAPAWAGFTVLAWAGGVVLALLVLREWESPVQAGSLVQAGLLGQAEVIGLAAGGRAIGTVDPGAVDAGGRGA